MKNGSSNYINEQKEEHQLNHILASPTKRFWAVIMDSFIFGIPFYLYFGYPDTFFNTQQIYGIFAEVISSAVFYPFFSATLGHRILGIKVIYVETEKNCNSLIMGLFREFLKCTMGYLIVPVIWLFWDKRQQNL